VHHVRHTVEWDSGADAGPDDTYADERQFEITARGIDPDELAELRAIVVRLNVGPGTDVIAQDEIGAIQGTMECGYNLSGEEFLGAGGGSSFDIDSDASGTDDYVVRTKDTDEVGQLCYDTLSAWVGYSDTTDGTGGSAAGAERFYIMNMADLFGSGPFVDAADDFTTRITLGVKNLVGEARAVASYSLYYDVSEVEGGRTRFGR
jgi:hypothetical protein